MDETPPTPPPADPLPQVNGYRLLRPLGRGGMSTVYLAEQAALGREVAIKVMAPQALADEISRRRFENEVRTIARLEHPHIVRIHELGRTRDGLPYYSMPHLSRGHLGDRDYVRDEAGAVEIALALLAALEYAHSRGVVHRDVKPENVLFDDAGRPLLADFGIALRRGFGARVTTAGLAVGSTAYMAPEQARGEEVDGRADLYSLGVVIWEMLAGRLPYEAADALSMAIAHAQQPIPRMPPHLRHWQRFMYRALAKSPDSRFQNAADMREALLAVRPPRWLPAWERTRAMFGGRRAGIAVVVLAVAGLAWAGWSAWRDGDTQDAEAVATAAATPTTEAPPGPDPTERMLAPLPAADIELGIERARAQIARNALTAPEGDNAMATLQIFAQEHPRDPRVRAVAVQLVDAMRARLPAMVRAGDDAKARDLALRSDRIAATLIPPAPPAAPSPELQKALRTRVDEAAARSDRRRADQALALARDFRVPASELARWSGPAARSERPARAGDEMADVGRGRVATHPVTREEFQRFVEDTRRPPALCRERTSLLRVLAPRSWQAPGFAQGPADPVVCVSLQDAEAYALWLGNQSGGRFRLPTSAESARTPADVGGRAIGLWLRDCGNGCLERMVTAGSWRGRATQQALTANRGYDDVGFRLYRER